MDNEYFENSYRLQGDTPVRSYQVPTFGAMPTHQFQQEVLGAKTLKAKLAVCFKKLSESGAFSDASEEVWELKSDVMKSLPEGLQNGREEGARAG